MFVRGIGFSLFFFTFGLGALALGVFALVDAARRPDNEWVRANQSKTLWIVLIAVGFLMCALGIVIDLVYFFAIRPQLERAGSDAGALAGGPAAAVAAAVAAPVAAVAPAAGWYPDPHRRHELRYFDGFRWTENISDRGDPGVDPV